MDKTDLQHFFFNNSGNFNMVGGNNSLEMLSSVENVIEILNKLMEEKSNQENKSKYNTLLDEFKTFREEIIDQITNELTQYKEFIKGKLSSTNNTEPIVNTTSSNTADEPIVSSPSSNSSNTVDEPIVNTSISNDVTEPNTELQNESQEAGIEMQPVSTAQEQSIQPETPVIEQSIQPETPVIESPNPLTDTASSTNSPTSGGKPLRSRNHKTKTIRKYRVKTRKNKFLFGFGG